jgi:type IV pilus assembly protein PilY1
MALLNSKLARMRTGAATCVAVALISLLGAGAANAQVLSQTPLSAGGEVPSNVVLTPSVEFPTVNSKANIGAFVATTLYYGYFDPKKCYKYTYDAVEANRFFYPVRVYSATAAALCTNTDMEWSGNWLNWATTQTIDGFRKALTGGLRVSDSTTQTILEKARHDGQGGAGYFPNATITGAATIRQAIPATSANGWTTLTARVWGGGNQLFITGTNGALANQLCPGNTDAGAGTVYAGIDTYATGYPGPVNSAGTIQPATPHVLDYNPAVHVFNTLTTGTALNCNTNARPVNKNITNANRIFRLSMRVKVCVTGMLEDNCVAYSGVAKPEGLIQKYQRKMRYSVFGYLVDNQMFRDGGVLRANQKYVGPERLRTDTGLWEDNPNKEWDATTGVLVVNPNPADATATTTAINAGATGTATVQNSGVINYVNKFAQNDGIFAKNYDPVSELYYTASRYLRHKGTISTYNDLTRSMTNNTTGTAVTTALDRWKLADNFPVITDWQDPFQFWCQNTAIIGIGDVYTHRDKNLAGRESTTDEPAAIGDAGTDTDFTGTGKNSVAWWTRKVYEKEGITYPSIPLGGLQNSPYIAGLAYYMHTQDIRTDLGPTAGANNEKQTVSTHWVDVRETQRIEPRKRNQYWLAAKYGGFLVPEETDDPDDALVFNALDASALPTGSWESPDSLTSNSNDATNYPNETFTRTANYYLGDRPDTMISSLTRAFAKFGSEAKGSGASLAANSTRLDTTTLTFQAQFQNSIWMGQLNAYSVNSTTGALSALPLWTASANMPAWNSRNIFVNAASGATDNYVAFNWANLSAGQKTTLNTMWATMPAGVDGEDIVEYVRGRQSLEESNGGKFRTRTPPSGWSHMLGDIVNSTPVFVGAPNGQLYTQSAGSWNGKTTHDDYAAAHTGRRPVVWVGGNDGMIHGFDASINSNGTVTGTSGDELYAFMPAKSISTGLVQFANPNYAHKYFVDGDIAVADVYNGVAWKTILVGTMGRGGPGLFALDITDPLNVVFLWERDETDANLGDLGHNIGRPVIAQVANGDWRVVFGNGVDSANGKATLMTIDVFDGTASSIVVDSGSANGLSAVLARDTDADGLADTFYAGDLEGSLWKVTSLSGEAGGASASSMLLFAAEDSGGNPQPITAAPLVGRDPNTEITWVFFGTGKFLNEEDLSDTQSQSWYGIKDTGSTVTRGNLKLRAVTATGTIGDFGVRVISQGVAGDMDGLDGWYMDLPISKERIVVPNRFQGSALIGTTRIPDASDACRPTGRGYIMAINPFTGARLTQTFFDTNRDGLFNDSDMLSGDVVSGIGIDSSPNNPIFIENVMQFSKDDGTTDAVRVQGGNADARRASWREITH